MNATGFRQYIIVEQGVRGLQFFIAQYIMDLSDSTNTDQGIDFDFNNFSGELYLQNLEKSGNQKFVYKNGKRGNKKSSAKGNERISTGISSRSTTIKCTATSTCTWQRICLYSGPNTSMYAPEVNLLKVIREGYGCSYPTLSDYGMSCYGAYHTTAWQQTSIEVNQTCVEEQPEPDQPDPYAPDPYNPGSGDGGSGPPSVEEAFDPNDVYLFNGQKPLAEYQNNCQGASGMWNMAVSKNREVAGVLTLDGKLMIVAVLNQTTGTFGGLYYHQGTTYYTWPQKDGAPKQSYPDIKKAAGYYLIPIKAYIHTHNPCLQDGTNGLSHPVSDEDKLTAKKFPSIPHYVIGCNALGKTMPYASNYTLIQTGSLATTCSKIQ